MTQNDYSPTPPPWLQSQAPEKSTTATAEPNTPAQGTAAAGPGTGPIPKVPAQPDLPVPPDQPHTPENGYLQANPRHQAPAGTPVPPDAKQQTAQGQAVSLDADGTARHLPPLVPNQPQTDASQQHYPGPEQYQSPPEQPQPNPIYTWEPPPSVAQQPQQQLSYLAWPGQQSPQEQYQSGQSVQDLTLLRRAKRAPRSGWRLAVHKATGGAVNPGESPADMEHRALVERVNQPVRGDYRIAILSLKGGVGKTTTTVSLGSTFAELRGDRVIALDANPDLGTLAHRVPKQTRSTVRNLLEDPHIRRYSDVRAHTSQAPSRLEVLASEQDPAVSEAFTEEDYRATLTILQAFYNIILTDCGTGLMHSAMSGVLDMASSLVLVTSPAIDGARSASATLDWLEHHGYNKLVERTVVVVNASRRGSSSVDLDQLRRLFLDRTRAVQVIPFDDHLAEGAEVDLDLVAKPTRRALLELAATVADDFAFAGGKHATP